MRSNFFHKSCRLRDTVGKYGTARQATHDSIILRAIMRCAGYRRTVKIFNINCFRITSVWFHKIFYGNICKTEKLHNDLCVITICLAKLKDMSKRTVQRLYATCEESANCLECFKTKKTNTYNSHCCWRQKFTTKALLCTQYFSTNLTMTCNSVKHRMHIYFFTAKWLDAAMLRYMCIVHFGIVLILSLS
jgi:hypothetical protein